MATMKTPGVYIVDRNPFPNSVVEAATAVPAFVGHTALADNDGKPLHGKPWRITSMAEYERHFGGAAPARFRIERVAATAPTPALPDMLEPRGQCDDFQHGATTYRLTRAAGRAGGRFLMHQAMRLFFRNGGGPCHVVSVGGFDDEIAAGDVATGLIGGLTPLLKESEPTLLVLPDAVLLSRADCMRVQKTALQHCGGEMKNRFAVLDVWGGDLARRHPAGDCIARFRDDIGTDFLSYGAAYFPWLHASVSRAEDLDAGHFDNADDLAALLRDDPGLLEPLLTEARKQLDLLPPSAAMAGLYTMVDNTRGVWKAPANVSLAAVIAPAVDITHEDQEDLNVTPQGKSINAIRTFIDEGVLVWGARTLDGSSLDWRYVNVRRTMIMLEESCRLAAKALVFEPNGAGTWMTLKSMLDNFLIGLWKRGALAGSVPEDAFSVHVGLGDTMTPGDVLEGLLGVTVLVAISRPAEFIEITFQQQMQKT
ncbi:MAG: phage tail sheath C-terminal domain-containing protein [Burkholderiaceae bacterium]